MDDADIGLVERAIFVCSSWSPFITPFLFILGSCNVHLVVSLS